MDFFLLISIYPYMKKEKKPKTSKAKKVAVPAAPPIAEDSLVGSLMEENYLKIKTVPKKK